MASAAAQTYAAVYASLASCLAPPTAPPSQPTQCVVLPNTNLDGDVVLSTTAPDVGACCERCQDTPGCNVLSFCPLPPPGCDDGSGKFYRSGECTLKTQTIAADGLPTWYGRVSGVRRHGRAGRWRAGS